MIGQLLDFAKEVNHLSAGVFTGKTRGKAKKTNKHNTTSSNEDKPCKQWSHSLEHDKSAASRSSKDYEPNEIESQYFIDGVSSKDHEPVLCDENDMFTHVSAGLLQGGPLIPCVEISLNGQVQGDLNPYKSSSYIF